MLAANEENSRNGVPGSSSISMRPRGSILPWLLSRSRSRCGRIARAASCFWRNAATIWRLWAALRRNSALEVAIIDWILRIVSLFLGEFFKPRDDLVLFEGFALPIEKFGDYAIARRRQRHLQLHAFDGHHRLA